MRVLGALFFVSVLMTHPSSEASDITAVCREIIAQRPSLEASCRRLSSRTFSEGALRVSLKALKTNPTIAMEVLQTAQGRRIQRSSAEVCEEYVFFHPWNAGPCIDAISNRQLSLEVLRIARKLIQKKDGRLALDILAWREGTELNPELSVVCEEVAARSPALAEKCVRTILGKRRSKGVESCRGDELSGEAKVDCLARLERPVERSPASIPPQQEIEPQRKPSDEVTKALRTQRRVRYRNGPSGNLDAFVMP